MFGVFGSPGKGTQDCAIQNYHLSMKGSPGFSITGEVNLEPGDISGILLLRCTEILWALLSVCKLLCKNHGLPNLN